MKRFIISALIVLVTSVVGITFFLSPDSLMDCSQSPSDLRGCTKADVIIAVSGGDTASRTQLAIDLYERGWADELIFSGAAYDKSGPSNAEVMREQAIRQGVPISVITVEDQSETTSQNAEKTTGILANRDISSAILVTSSYHAKRTLLEFRERAPEIEFRSHPTSSDKQWSIWWWTKPYGWYLAVSEVVKIIVFYIGGSR